MGFLARDGVGVDCQDGRIPNLWPELNSGNGPVSPMSVLRRQAMVITEMTGERVRGEVQSRMRGREFIHVLQLTALGLGDFEYFLIRLRHSIDSPYPCRVSLSEKEDRYDEVNSVDELLSVVKQVLHNDKTQEVVSALLAYSE